MHYGQSEKMEVIRLVERSDLGVIRTLRQLKVNKTTFYNWYRAYQEQGYDGLARRSGKRKEVWNKSTQRTGTRSSRSLWHVPNCLPGNWHGILPTSTVITLVNQVCTGS